MRHACYGNCIRIDTPPIDTLGTLLPSELARDMMLSTSHNNATQARGLHLFNDSLAAFGQAPQVTVMPCIMYTAE